MTIHQYSLFLLILLLIPAFTESAPFGVVDPELFVAIMGKLTGENGTSQLPQQWAMAHRRGDESYTSFSGD